MERAIEEYASLSLDLAYRDLGQMSLVLKSRSAFKEESNCKSGLLREAFMARTKRISFGWLRVCLHKYVFRQRDRKSGLNLRSNLHGGATFPLMVV